MIGCTAPHDGQAWRFRDEQAGPADASNVVTNAFIETIGNAGFTVRLSGQDGLNVVEAVNEETGGTFVVRREDLYLVVVEREDG